MNATRAMIVSVSVVVSVVVGGACATPATGGSMIDAAPRDAPPPCGVRDLELGRCQRDDGTPCTGALGEVRRFAELPDGGFVPLVNGPQGAAMLVFSARTEGIVAGDPDDPIAPDNPLLELVASRDGIELAIYRGKVGFAPDGAGRVVAAGLFVITEGTDLTGMALTAHGQLTDVAGTRRCGEVGFTAARSAAAPAAPAQTRTR